MLAQNGNASFSATVDIKDCMSKSVILLRSFIFSQLIYITHSSGPFKGRPLFQSSRDGAIPIKTDCFTGGQI